MTDQTNNLYNETNFYQAFIKDALKAESEVIIYSPFISRFRAEYLREVLVKLRRRKIKVFIFSRPIEEHEPTLRDDIKAVTTDFESLGAQIFYPKGFMHEKLAIIDRKTLWEGSLNILSQRLSKEIMRRITDDDLVAETISYLGIDRKLPEANNRTGSMRLSFSRNVQIFFHEGVLPLVKWSLSAVLNAMVLIFKAFLFIFSIIGAIFR